MNIPVYTVGIGNPEKKARLELGTELGEVNTQLEEAPLEQIAAETKGKYIAARTNPPQLGTYFRSQIEPLPGREVSDEALPLPRERYVWFLLPALGFLLIGWVRGR